WAECGSGGEERVDRGCGQRAERGRGRPSRPVPAVVGILGRNPCATSERHDDMSSPYPGTPGPPEQPGGSAPGGGPPQDGSSWGGPPHPDPPTDTPRGRH